MKRIKTKDELYAEIDLLQGNINRICVTDNLIELYEMTIWAQKRIENIYDYNKIRLMIKEDKQ